MRYALVMALMALCLATTAFAGANPNFTLPMHGKVGLDFLCTGYQPVDCLNNQPTVDLPPGQATIFLLIMNYDRVAGVQTAYQVPATWLIATQTYTCQPGQLNGTTPAAPWGPDAGALATAFDCLVGPSLGVFGTMLFLNIDQGCLTQVEPDPRYPNGTHVVDCQQGRDQILLPGQEARLGMVCVGSGGRNACEPLVPVEPATWGGIKAQYN